MHGKCQMIIIFSFMSGIFLVGLGRVTLGEMLGLGGFGHSTAKRSAFPSLFAWLCAFSKNALKSLVDLLLFLIFAGAVGFAIVCVCTGGLPFDSSIR